MISEKARHAQIENRKINLKIAKESSFVCQMFQDAKLDTEEKIYILRKIFNKQKKENLKNGT